MTDKDDLDHDCDIVAGPAVGVNAEGAERVKDWEDVVERQIREAQERGDFDDLPGKGRPLDLTSNPFARDQELAFKVLKDAGYAPEWIELDKGIRRRQGAACASLERSGRARKARLSELEGRADAWAAARRERVKADWRRAVSRFLREMAAINSEIETLNLKVPSSLFQRHKVDAAGQVAEVEADWE